MLRTLAPPVFLVDLDPDLFADVPDERGDLRQMTRVNCVTVPAGPWDPAPLAAAAYFGVLLITGKLAGTVGVGTRKHLEILGPGDVGQPYVSAADSSSLPAPPTWRVLQEAQVAILDRRFAHVIERHPAVSRALMERLVVRTRRLLFQLALLSEPRVARRIELVMLHFAERWGHVTPDGILLDLPLSHEHLAQIVAAQRPSVTTALTQLAQSGRLERRGRREWLLPPS